MSRKKQSLYHEQLLESLPLSNVHKITDILIYSANILISTYYISEAVLSLKTMETNNTFFVIIGFTLQFSTMPSI